MKYVQSTPFYIVLIFLPSLILFAATTSYFINDSNDNLLENNRRIALQYSSGVLKTILETKTTIETIAHILELHENSPKDAKPFLETTMKYTPSLFGLYIVNVDGTVTYSTHDLKSINISERDYFKKVIQTKKTVFSQKMLSLVSDDYINIFATPIKKKDETINEILVVSFDIDKMLLQYQMVSNPPNLAILNGKGQVIYGDETIANGTSQNNIGEVVLENNWLMKYESQDVPLKSKILQALLAFLLTFGFIHFIYFFILYVLVKQKREYENEIANYKKLELLGEFAASTAHEIKNPLTGVQGLVSLLQEKYKDDEDQFYFTVIKEELKRINEISSQFLILGKPIEQINEIFVLQDPFKQVIPLLEYVANQRNIKLHVKLPEDDILFYGCFNQISQIALNLVQNAIDASNQGDDIVISVELVTDDLVEIKIIDKGIGIPAKSLQKIFQPFYSTKENGTGLGLVICKKLIDNYNGSISIHSKPKQGTTVKMTLPITNTTS